MILRNGLWILAFYVVLALCLVPATILLSEQGTTPGLPLQALGNGLLDCLAVAVAEELLFRGFPFQRLVDGIGAWPAQLLMAGYFVLTHSTGLAAAPACRRAEQRARVLAPQGEHDGRRNDDHQCLQREAGCGALFRQQDRRRDQAEGEHHIERQDPQAVAQDHRQYL